MHGIMLLMGVDLHKAYAARLASGALVADAGQDRALAALQDLCIRLARPAPRRRLFAGNGKPPPPRGLYLHGPVGRGKSMLMDLFFHHAPVKKKRRVHFHQFMLEIHALLHQRRQNGHEADPLVAVAQEIAAQYPLLCFDEFYVSDIADAMILARLFAALFDAGLVLVATSNQPPERLYEGGLQRALFLPFIEVLKAHVDSVAVEGARDHRRDRLRGREVFFTPLGSASSAALAEIFTMLTGGDAAVESCELDLPGRKFKIARAAKGVAWCDFDALCGQPRGAPDYLALAESFHTLILDGVPQLRAEQRNEAVRFITLIDALYEARARLVMAAAAPPEQLYPEGQHAAAFQRAVSRLQEMRSADYPGLSVKASEGGAA